jgi:lysine 2,3-aminomutase
MQTMKTSPWKTQLQHGITSSTVLCDTLSQLAPQRPVLDAVTGAYPVFINSYISGLLKEPGDPLWQQFVPDARELEDTDGMDDPLAEDSCAPVPNITHRYPDRVLFLVSNRCAVHCRFCTRKRKIGRQFNVTPSTLSQGIDYIRNNPQVRDVLLSGGDPLLLPTAELANILSRLRAIPHVEIIRIGTRVPGVLPERVNPHLARTLARFKPLYINTHFNHPDEITPQSRRACDLLADAGIPLGCQTVLLKGINDSSSVMRELMQSLLSMRVRPYYLHHMDYTRGTKHFRTSLTTGLKIITGLRGHVSGLCIPHYVIDLPGGGGKIPLTPEFIQQLDGETLLVKNFQGRVFRYDICREDVQTFRKRYAP